MGSIVMHLCASNEANKVLKLDSNKFLIGSIAPDIHKIKNGSRVNSHYIEKYTINGKNYELPNLEQFFKENIDKVKEDPFAKGYYAHLIADRIWYMEVANKYTEKISEDKKMIKLPNTKEYILYEDFKKMMYEDYSNINNYLIKKYNIDVDYLYNVAVLNIEKSELQELMQMNKDKENTKDFKLNILVLEDILNWIEKSKNEIIEKLSDI